MAEKQLKSIKIAGLGDAYILPTATSDLINDSGYITEDSVPTKVSQLTNDKGYITSSDIPTVPTKVSQLTNDSGYITSASIPTKTSQLTNNSGYITSSSVPTKVSQLTNDKGYITSAVSSLGFSPVQQGGGVGQSTNKVYIGWSGSRLKVTVDQTDLGNIVFDNHVLITQIGNTTTTCSYDYSNDNSAWYSGTVTMDWTYKVYSDGSAEAVGISRNDVPVWTCASWGSWHETGQFRIPSPLSFKDKPHVEVAASTTGAWYVSEGATYVSNTVATYFCRATENVSERAYLTVHIHGKLA